MIYAYHVDNDHEEKMIPTNHFIIAEMGMNHCHTQEYRYSRDNESIVIICDWLKSKQRYLKYFQ